MIAGLVKNTGPTLNVPVPDSKDRNSEIRGQKFSDILEPKTERAPKKEDIVKAEPDKAKLRSEPVRVKSTENRKKVESQEDSESQTEGPPDPKVMDPRTSATRAQRDRAIRQFMDSFESEFGIPPEEMVEAMSQLTTQDLEKPPEKTVDTLIAQLGLQSEDEAQAKKMYMGLVVELKQIDTRVALPKVHDDLLSQMSAQRVQLSADKKDVAASQVQGLSDKFWMRGANAEKTVSPEMNQLQVREFMKKMVTAESAGVSEQAMANPELMASTENLLNQLKTESSGELKTEEGSELSVKGETSFMPESAAMKALAENAKSQSQNGQQQHQQEGEPGNQNPQAQPLLKAGISQEVVQAEFKRLGIKPTEQLATKKLGKAEVESMLNLEAGSLSQAKYETLQSAVPALAVQPLTMSPVEKTENMQQIMNQAQFLIKNGGGEVKVEMTPEGMGSIQMKLQVIDGKVQIQMNTETKEAKQLIEASMHDLKQALSAHQLSMDLVKVDVVQETSSAHKAQNDLQSQMENFMNNQQRDGMKQHWQQFNESFGNRQARDNFIDASNIRSPVKNQTLPGFDSASSNGRASSDGRGKSLNLVA